MNKNEFIAYLAPYAVQLRLEGSPMFPSVRLAQNLLETGGVIHPWYNLGGIKVGSGKPNEWWDGSSVNRGTWEVVNGTRVETSANFRAYQSVYHFYQVPPRGHPSSSDTGAKGVVNRWHLRNHNHFFVVPSH
jgi:flagellum-specific peptidoglycan hydrolase FlgJ